MEEVAANVEEALLSLAAIGRRPPSPATLRLRRLLTTDAINGLQMKTPSPNK